MAQPTSGLDLVLAEHRHLNALFNRVEESLQGKTIDTLALQQRLDELQAHLREHFVYEEQTGFFEQIVKKEPRLESAAQALKQQHASMSDALDRIRAAVHQPQIGKEELRNAANDLLQFRITFDEHEEGENRLLQEAFDRDVGSKD